MTLWLKFVRWKSFSWKIYSGYHNASLLPDQGRNQDICDFNKPPKPGKTCGFDVSRSKFKECAYSTDYGYNHSSPCVFIKLNKVRYFHFSQQRVIASMWHICDINFFLYQPSLSTQKLDKCWESRIAL